MSFRLMLWACLALATALQARWKAELLPFGAPGTDFDDWTLPQPQRKPEVWERLAQKKTPPPELTNLPDLLGEDLLWLWQHSLSGHDGSQCPYYPSCSRYSRIAVRDYGLLPGVIMSAERLERCHSNANESGQYPRAEIEGKLMIWDPPRMDAWWAGK